MAQRTTLAAKSSLCILHEGPRISYVYGSTFWVKAVRIRGIWGLDFSWLEHGPLTKVIGGVGALGVHGESRSPSSRSSTDSGGLVVYDFSFRNNRFAVSGLSVASLGGLRPSGRGCLLRLITVVLVPTCAYCERDRTTKPAIRLRRKSQLSFRSCLWFGAASCLARSRVVSSCFMALFATSYYVPRIAAWILGIKRFGSKPHGLSEFGGCPTCQTQISESSKSHPPVSI